MMQETETGVLNPPPVSDEVLSLEGKNFSSHQAQGHRSTVAKKRAFEFARLLQAKMHLLKYEREFKNPQKIEQLFSLDEFRVAINTILGAIKSVRVGANILEITTCGAIPPYNHLLGGKLVAMLMLSPQIAADYQKRYGNEPSIISS